MSRALGKLPNAMQPREQKTPLPPDQRDKEPTLTAGD